MFAAVQKQPLSESVYRQLKQKIVNHELAAGDELPSERVLGEMLGVNRGAVREAIKRLQQAGLVAVRHGGNHVVMDYQEEGGLELLPALLVDARGGVNAAVVRSIMSLRAALAPEVAAAAARQGGAKLANELDAVLLRMRAAEADLKTLQTLALDFWRLLVNAGGNIAFRLAFNSMNKTYTASWNLLTQVMAAEFRDLDNLQDLAHAVRKRDAVRAHKFARSHVDIGTRAIDAMFSKLPRAARTN